MIQLSVLRMAIPLSSLRPGRPTKAVSGASSSILRGPPVGQEAVVSCDKIARSHFGDGPSVVRPPEASA
jgi:hypothetical protein